MFHMDCPKGKSFSVGQVDQLIEEGWVDSPAKLDLPEEQKVRASVEQVQEADPQTLVNLTKALGFKVLTDIEFQIEVNKAKPAAFDITSVTDDELIAEAERRGLKNSTSDSIELLQEQFDEEPTELTKDELVMLGNEKFKLGLRSNMKEDTLIEKIKAAMDV